MQTELQNNNGMCVRVKCSHLNDWWCLKPRRGNCAHPVWTPVGLSCCESCQLDLDGNRTPDSLDKLRVGTDGEKYMFSPVWRLVGLVSRRIIQIILDGFQWKWVGRRLARIWMKVRIQEFQCKGFVGPWWRNALTECHSSLWCNFNTPFRAEFISPSVDHNS